MLIPIGKGLNFDIPQDAWLRMLAHDNVKDHFIFIGAKNVFKDCHASVVREDYDSDDAYKAASLAMVEKTFAAKLAGEVRSNSSGPRVSSKNPIEAEALRLARVVVYAAAKAKGQTDKAIIQAAIAKYAAKPETIATATANVAAKAALTVDDDLGL